MAKQTARKTTMDPMRSPTAFRGITKSRTKAVPTEEQIRARAFEIYQRRNGAPGDPHADWLQAERELIEESSR